MRQLNMATIGARPLKRISGSWALGIAAIALLAACDSNPFASAQRGSATGSVELVERDVEAPEIFHTTAAALWDGRPSLGGVWVAHPSVADPERVIIRNPATGAFVIGALFRRGEDGTGPALQVSSDAAAALGLRAGEPGELSVTALRRQDAAAPAPTPQSAPVADPGTTPAPPLPPATVTAETLAPATPAQAPAPAASAATAAPAPAAPVSAANATPAAERPYIQLGIFSVEANAAALVRSLNADGLPASAVAAEVQGRPFWRVIVGPAATDAQRARYLEQVKALGFGDAYAVRN